MNCRLARRCRWLAAVAAALLVAWVTPPAPLATTYHVSTRGSDSNPGTLAKPFRTPQRGVDVARPGDVILVHAGSYSGRIKIDHSGLPGLPITLRSAGDGPVTLTAYLVAEPCTRTSVARDRTLRVIEGADYWRIQGLNIVGGILVTGTNIDGLLPYVRDRSLPGRGQYDPAAADLTLEFLGSDGADHIEIIGNTITKRGIATTAARAGSSIGNKIFNIDCGTGPGISIALFSDKWVVRNNYIHHIPWSSWHPNSEGVRLATQSGYNRVENNLVEDLEDYGRAFAADVTTSWNVISGNTGRRAYGGFNDQDSGWGNQWIGNVAESNRRFGFAIAVKFNNLPSPDERVPAYLLVRCNKVKNSPEGLNIGAVQQSTFEKNAFPTVILGQYLRGYWEAAGNTWDGSSKPPPYRPGQKSC